MTKLNLFTEFKCYETLKETFLSEFQSIGFTDFYYVIGSINKKDIEPINGHFLTSYSESFLSDYNFDECDQIRNIALDNQDISHWIPPEHNSNPTILESIAFDHGISNGFSYRLNKPGGVVGIGLCATNMQHKEYDKDVMPNISKACKIAQAFHFNVNNLMQSTKTPLNQSIDLFTKKELQLINSLYLGNRQRIADSLFISKSTVEKRMDKIKLKLSANSDLEIVEKSRLYGYI